MRPLDRYRLLVCAAACTLASLPAGPRADESNFRPYLIGTRAAGMGGAFTALADDGSGPFYNPAGIGFVKRSQLSLSGSVYGVASGSIDDALGDGHSVKYGSIQTLPTATAAVFKLGEDRPDEASVLAITVYVPDAVLIDSRDTIASQQNAFILTTQSQTVWGGLTYARRWGRLSIGASGFLLIGNQISQLDITAAIPNAAIPNCPAGVTCASSFASVTARAEQTTFGFIGGVGARWDPTDHLRFGVSVYSPELGFGSRKEFVRVAGPNADVGNVTTANVVNVDNLHATPSIPLRAQVGAAWTSGRFTVAADVMYLAPREVRDDENNALGFGRRVTRNGVVNGSAGIEYVFADRYPFRTGVFTDFAASNTPVATLPNGTDPNAANTAHIDRYGGSVSIGFRTDHTSTDVGVMISGGSGKDVVPNNFDFANVKPASAAQLFTYFFLGTAYEF